MLGRIALLLALTLCVGCVPSPEKRQRERMKAFEARRDSANKRARANFQRLPPCPSALGVVTGDQHTFSGVRLPASFRRDDSVSFDHGGARYRSGDTIVDVTKGAYTWISLTDRYDGSGILPNGCVARIAGQIYLVTEGHDSTRSRFWAFGTAITDTVEVLGCTNIRVRAPRPVRAYVLQLFGIRDLPANERCS